MSLQETGGGAPGVNTTVVRGAAAFVDSSAGGSLTLVNSSTDAGSVTAGVGGGSGANNGQAAGSSLFLNGGNASISVTGSNSETIAGTIAQSGIGANSDLTKLGSGTLILSGNNTSLYGYSGGTTISAGTLLANGTGATGIGAVTVQSGGTLGGLGSVVGPTTVQSGGTLAPGSLGTFGTLSFTGSLTMADGSTATFTLGSSSDLVNVSAGPLSLWGTLNVLAGQGFGGGTCDLFIFTTLSNPGQFSMGTAPSGYTCQVVDNTTLDQVDLIVTPSSVPEPPSAVLAGLGLAALAGLVAWRRRVLRPSAA